MKLPIKPMSLQEATKKQRGDIINLKNFPLNQLEKIFTSGIKETYSTKNAIVAYVDVLGFSDKKSDEEIEATLNDFPAALAESSLLYPTIRFNVFSDNAFLATRLDDAHNLIAAIRYSYQSWLRNGIFVRGGIALGSYSEFQSVALKKTNKNFNGSLFAGSGVTKAVKIEAKKPACLLFTDEECATFLNKKYKEPIFLLEGKQVIGWADDGNSLLWFTSISLFRLLKLLSYDVVDKTKTNKLLNNLTYVKAFTEYDDLATICLIILSFPSIDQGAVRRACKLLKIKLETLKAIQKNNKEKLNEWLKLDKWIIIKTIAEIDSSL